MGLTLVVIMKYHHCRLSFMGGKRAWYTRTAHVLTFLARVLTFLEIFL